MIPIGRTFIQWVPVLCAATAFCAAQVETRESTGFEAYQPVARRIIDTVLAGNEAYQKLQELCDDIGPRLSGSKALEQAVRWSLEAMRRDELENVRAEPVMVPHWVRGEESLTLVSPRRENLPMLGLGGSVGTPPEGITAEVVVVGNEDELAALGDAVKGKIVLFNNEMPRYTPEEGSHYGTAVRFRRDGARLAARRGAVACLVRSVTAGSLRSAHTGALQYDEHEPKIPAAAITIEDAQMFARWQARGISAKVALKMGAKNLGQSRSANVIGEIRGRTAPDEIVVIGAHLDSWDVGQGAHDDGAGVVMCLEAAATLKKLELVPRRTIRVVLWTNEENGLMGARQYVEEHRSELSRHVAAIESDSGGFAPKGYVLECPDKQREVVAAQQMKDLLFLVAELGATQVSTGGSGADVGLLKPGGGVLLGHQVDVSTYFDYHHSHADTVDKVDPVELSRNVAVLAVVAYVLADTPGRIGDGADSE